MALRRFLRAVADGGRLRCPACRRGAMSPGRYRFFSMHDACPGCGIPFTPGRGESVGGVEIATYVTALLGLLGVAALATGRAPLWAYLVFALGFGTLFPILSYRHAKGVWVGAMYGALAWSVAGDLPHVAPVTLPWGEPESRPATQMYE